MGTKESISFANLLSSSKVVIVVFIIIAGLFYVKTSNWSNFFSHGITGVYRATSLTLIGYGGFDAITAIAEESENVKRDMTKAVVCDTVLCGILYMGTSIVVCGISVIDSSF